MLRTHVRVCVWRCVCARARACVWLHMHPLLLRAQTRRLFAGFGGENALARYDQTAYSTIESQSHSIAEFTYLRLGPTLMQGGNFQAFEAFVGAMAKI